MDLDYQIYNGLNGDFSLDYYQCTGRKFAINHHLGGKRKLQKGAGDRMERFFIGGRGVRRKLRNDLVNVPYVLPWTVLTTVGGFV